MNYSRCILSTWTASESEIEKLRKIKGPRTFKFHEDTMTVITTYT